MPVAPPSRVRLRDIADSSGLSVATVSMALANHPNVNQQTKQRVRQISRELGYKPTAGKSPSRSRLKRIGLMMLGCDLTNTVSAMRVQSLIGACEKQNTRLELSCIETDYEAPDIAAKVAAFASDLDGLILEGYVNTTLLEQLNEMNVRYVAGGLVRNDTLPPYTDYHGIVSDATSMGRCATEWFIAQGHRRIGFACTHMHRGFWTDRWCDGYRLALCEAGLNIDKALIYVTPTQDIDDALAGDAAAEAFAGLPDVPTAFVVPGWGMALSLRDAMRQRGVDLPAGRIVSSMLLERTAQRPIDGFPLICVDSAKVALATLRQLEHVCRHPQSPPVQVYVPFTTVNFKPVDQSNIRRIS